MTPPVLEREWGLRRAGGPILAEPPLCTRHWARSFLCLVPFGPHSDPMKQAPNTLPR